MIISEKTKKIIYFIIPHLLYMTLFFYFYNSIFFSSGEAFEILYREVFILSLVYFILCSIVYIILKSKIDYLKIFFLMISLILLSFAFVYESIVMWVSIVIFNIFVFKTNENTRVMISFLVSIVIVILLLGNFIPATISWLKTVIRYEEKDVNIKFEVNEESATPNIYWIHCDGMINLKDVNKFFNYDPSSLKQYFNENQFYINEEASFYSGGHTIQALISLYNPYYYDEIFNNYLEELNKNNKLNKVISYDFMTEKRMNNELFRALKEKKYKLAMISDYNQYSSFYGDYMFDYYSFQKSKKKDLKYFTSDENSYMDVKNYNYYSHLKVLADCTFLHFFTDNYNFMKYKEIDYNNFVFTNYNNIANSDYWKSKAILKSLDTVYNQTKKDKIFTFIDFDINHTPWLYDKNGKIVNTNIEGFLPSNYAANYEHSINLLIDILSYIKTNDEDAIIILQSDHGIHTVGIEYISKYTGYSQESLQSIKDSTFSAVYVPKKYINGTESHFSNPLNISRYLVNNFVGDNYQYIE